MNVYINPTTMTILPASLSASILVVLISCSDATDNKTANGLDDQRKTATGKPYEAIEPGSEIAALQAAGYSEGTDFQLFERVRIMDRKGFEQPAEAFSLLVPRGWKVEGEIIWNGPGSGCDGTNQQLKAVSPDGQYVFEMFPSVTWAWSGNAELREMQQGLPNDSKYCSYGQPMDAREYMQTKFAGGDLDNATVNSMEENQGVIDDMRSSNERARSELMNYGASDVDFSQSAVTAKLSFSDGSAGIALCGVSVMQTTVPNVYTGGSDQSYVTAATSRIVFRYPAGQEAQAEKMLSVIMSGYRTNPSWRDAVNGFWKDVRQQKHVVHVGRIRMMDEQTRAIGENAIRKGNERLQQMDVEMRSWEQRQQSQDRIHTEFIKTIRGVENYQDASGKVELSSGYDHAWSRSDGSTFIMTNNSSFDPSSVFQDQQWQEMKKVD